MTNTNSSFLSILLAGFLVAGYTIGAGILGLPIITGLAGFIPASIGMLLIWGALYRAAWFMAKQFIVRKDDNCDYLTLFKQELGSVGKWAAIIGFLIIYYGSLTAYLAGTAAIIKATFNLHISFFLLVLICFVIYTLIISYGVNAVQRSNFLLMMILIASFIYLSGTLTPHIQLKRYVQHIDWGFFPCIFSVMVFSAAPFLVVPTVCRKLKYDSKPVLIALIIGGVVSFIISFVWTAVTIGVLPITGAGQNNILFAYNHNLSATIPIAGLGYSNNIITTSVVFSILAIFTSYLGAGIAIIGFMKDFTYSLFRIRNKLLITLIAFIPPLIVTITNPNIFLYMLNFVGGAGFCLVGGVIPSIIYIKKTRNSIHKQIIGYTFFLFFSAIVIFEILQKIGLVNIIPHVKT